MRHRRLKVASRQGRAESSCASSRRKANDGNGRLWCSARQEANLPELIQISKDARAEWLRKAAECVAKPTAGEVGRQEAGKHVARLADDRAQNLIVVKTIACAYHGGSVIKQRRRVSKAHAWRKIVVIRVKDFCTTSNEAGQTRDQA